MMRRNSNAILGDVDGVPTHPQYGLPVTAHTDADIIMSAAILGFCANTLNEDKPVQFDAPNETGDIAALKRAVAKINSALKASGLTTGQVSQGVTNAWEEGAMITGRGGGSAIPFGKRDQELEDYQIAAKALREIIAKDEDVGYRGRGAYTGFVVLPKEPNRSSMKSTARANAPRPGDQIYRTPGSRWRPTEYRYTRKDGVPIGDEGTHPWGLIAGLTEVPGMQAIPATNDDVVGYIHGMVQAIYTCEGCKTEYPSNTPQKDLPRPYEIAAGQLTTKLASCFTCALFMYATDYPPSSIHLGRGESWAPSLALNDQAKGSNVIDKCIQLANENWHDACRSHVKMGLNILKKLKNTLVNATHRESLRRLEAYLQKTEDDPTTAAFLILDAVTIHDRETSRIDRTLQ